MHGPQKSLTAEMQLGLDRFVRGHVIGKYPGPELTTEERKEERETVQVDLDADRGLDAVNDHAIAEARRITESSPKAVRSVVAAAFSIPRPPNSSARRPHFDASAIFRKRREKIERLANRQQKEAEISGAAVDALAELEIAARAIGASLDQLLKTRRTARPLLPTIIRLHWKYAEQFGSRGGRKVLKIATNWSSSQLSDAIPKTSPIPSARSSSMGVSEGIGAGPGQVDAAPRILLDRIQHPTLRSRRSSKESNIK